MFSVFTSPPHLAEASTPGDPLADGNGHVQVSVSVSGGDPNHPSGVSEPSAGRPSTLTDIAQALEGASTAGKPRKEHTSFRAMMCGITMLLFLETWNRLAITLQAYKYINQNHTDSLSIMKLGLWLQVSYVLEEYQQLAHHLFIKKYNYC